MLSVLFDLRLQILQLVSRRRSNLANPDPTHFVRKNQFLPPAQPGDVLVPHLGISAKLPAADHGGVLGDGPTSRLG